MERNFACDSHIVNKSKNTVQTAKFLNGKSIIEKIMIVKSPKDINL